MTYYESEEQQPVTWLRGYPVYAAHLAMMVFVTSLVVCGILRAFGLVDALLWAMFQSDAVLKGEVWRVFTSGLVNVPSQMTVVWFAINMVMLVWFGREVEKTLGRRKFLALFAALYLVPTVILTAVGPWIPTTLAGEHCTFAIFIAFATLFPGVGVFFALVAKWLAVALLSLYTLATIADHDWAGLVSLWSTSLFAFAFIRHHQGHFSLPSFKLRRRPKLRVLPDLPAKRASAPKPATASMAEVDTLLDKIAKSGIGSLTAKERAKLDAAQRDLKNRTGR